MRRKKGDVQTYNLAALSCSPQHTGISFGVRHVGLGKLREWQFRVKRLLIEDKRKLKELREGLSEDDAPELFGEDVVTPDAEEKFLGLMRDILAEVCDELHGPGLKCETGPSRAEALEELGALELAYNAALRQQSLDPEHIFTAGPGDDGAGDPSDAGPDT